MNYQIVVAFAVLGLSIGAQAGDFFQDGKPVDIKRGTVMEPSMTLGGYPIYTGGDYWVLNSLTVKEIPIQRDSATIKMGTVAYDLQEIDKRWFATVEASAMLDQNFRGYWTGDPCGGNHLITVKRSQGRYDACMTVDAASFQGNDRPVTYFNIVVTNNAPGRFLAHRVTIDAGGLGFRNTSTATWSKDLIAEDPRKTDLINRIKAYGEKLLDANTAALDGDKAPGAFSAMPSPRSLMDIPETLSLEDTSQSVMGAIVQARNSRDFKAFAISRYGDKKYRWFYADERSTQGEADRDAVARCNAELPESAPRCELFPLDTRMVPAMPRAVPGKAAANVAKPVAPAAAVRPATDNTVQERLRKLKEMKDAGLIDQADFDAKKAEILKSL